MSKVRVHCFAVSVDGYGAGADQSLRHPLGVGGEALHEWQLATRAFHRLVLRDDGGATGVDDDHVARGFDGVGAWVMGRNMYGPVRGPWPDASWRGWWGDDPPFRCPVFVLTHHPRASFATAGGTTFHFVTGGIEDALARAKEAAGGQDVRIGGGVSTIRQCLQARLIDELHVAVAPVLLGRGEALWAGIDLPALGYGRREAAGTAGVLHVVFERG